MRSSRGSKTFLFDSHRICIIWLNQCRANSSMNSKTFSNWELFHLFWCIIRYISRSKWPQKFRISGETTVTVFRLCVVVPMVMKPIALMFVLISDLVLSAARPCPAAVSLPDRVHLSCVKFWLIFSIYTLLCQSLNPQCSLTTCW